MADKLPHHRPVPVFCTQSAPKRMGWEESLSELQCFPPIRVHESSTLESEPPCSQHRRQAISRDDCTGHRVFDKNIPPSTQPRHPMSSSTSFNTTAPGASEVRTIAAMRHSNKVNCLHFSSNPHYWHSNTSAFTLGPLLTTTTRFIQWHQPKSVVFLVTTKFLRRELFVLPTALTGWPRKQGKIDRNSITHWRNYFANFSEGCRVYLLDTCIFPYMLRRHVVTSIRLKHLLFCEAFIISKKVREVVYKHEH